ncbi:MAG: hypothetical protein M1391_04575 [Bacteroidetes bacterium]|nr:hypothetical protein [Bacteroidota bacterium]
MQQLPGSLSSAYFAFDNDLVLFHNLDEVDNNNFPSELNYYTFFHLEFYLGNTILL